MKDKACDLCDKSVNINDRGSYVYSRFRKAYYCSDFKGCDKRRGATHSVRADKMKERKMIENKRVAV